MAKPVVDRLESELDGQVELIRVNVLGGVGATLAARYGVRGVPTMLVLDGAGQVIYARAGMPDREAIRAAVAAASSP
ncbi:MAG: thioredoxin family protein [Anaerolineae bacterium]|nr:thioredoxin family protein [Anaerolineae bacterium]